MLVGGGDDEAMLRSAAAGLTNMTFTGFVDNVGDYLASFDVFVLPSNREGIGSILFDAMEAGLPVVASRVGGVPSIVHDGETGFLIDAASPDQLRAAILLLKPIGDPPSVSAQDHSIRRDSPPRWRRSTSTCIAKCSAGSNERDPDQGAVHHGRPGPADRGHVRRLALPAWT
jgi:hypothetical protein